MRKERALFFVLALSMALSACGGGGGGTGSTLPSPGGGGTGNTGQTPQEQQQSSVGAANAAGSSVEDISGFETAIQDPVVLMSGTRHVSEATASPHPTSSPGTGPTASPSPAPEHTPVPSGTCIPLTSGKGPFQSLEYWKPDKAGDANSVEYQLFFDTACAQLGEDRVRIITSQSGAGTVKTQTQTTIVTEYAAGNPVAVSSSTHTDTITGQFDAAGYPILKNGFARASTLVLTQNGNVVLNKGNEFVSAPTSSTSSTYCGDSAGYSPQAFTSTAQIHGEQSLLASGTRTVNADGSVTYAHTGSGSTFSAAPPAALSLNKGALNTVCPIAAPAFTISGGAVVSSYNVPLMSVTFLHGVLQNLTITNATLSNGYTLNVTTSASAGPTSQTFISGTISKSGTTIATFSVDAFGNGTLTVASTGTQYSMVHWHVVTEHPPSPSPSGGPSEHPTPTSTPTHTPEPTPSHSPEPTPSHSPTPTPSHSPTPTPSPTHT